MRIAAMCFAPAATLSVPAGVHQSSDGNGAARLDGLLKVAL
jgi:hypothetical protein